MPLRGTGVVCGSQKEVKWGVTGLTSAGTFRAEVEGLSGGGGSGEQEGAGRGPEPAQSRQLRTQGIAGDYEEGPPGTEGMRGIWGFSKGPWKATA